MRQSFPARGVSLLGILHRGPVFALFVVFALCGEAWGQIDAEFTASPLSGSQPLVVSFTNTTVVAGGSFAMWDFGDGSTAIGHTPTHTYKVAQTTSFTVSLTVQSAMGVDTETKVDYLTVDPAPIVVDFSADVVSGINPLTVQFHELTSGAAINNFDWDFGDGFTAVGPNPIHTFEAGTTTSFTVTLTVTLAPQVESLAKADFITVNPAPLIVDFEADVTEGDPPLNVNFTDLSSGAEVTGWLWNFGNGDTSTSQHPSNRYDLPGDYDVTMTAFVGPQSEALTKSEYISVYPTYELNSDFSANPASGDNPLTVNFTNLSTGEIITGYLWDFGDGNTSTDTSPTHEYSVAQATAFDVTLTAFSGAQTSAAFQPGAIFVDTPFTQHVITEAVVTPETLLATDLDGDGDNDVVSGSSGDSTVAWFENTNSLGSFRARSVIDSGVQLPIDLDDADFDGDGDRDLLLLTAGDRRFSWYENIDGAGNFDTGNTILQYPFAQVWAATAADIDGDGDADVITRDGWVPNSDGLGGFGAEIPISFRRAMFYPADIDGDGDLDVFRVFNDSQKVDDSESVDWLRNDNGMGRFSYVDSIEFHYDSGVFPTGDHIAGDLDEDGDVDFLFTTGTTIYGYENSGDTLPTFDRRLLGSLISFQIPGLPTSEVTELEVFDLDGDGLLDIVSSLSGSNRVAWRRNLDRFERFAPTSFITTTPLNPLDLYPSDLDGDGDLDVLIADGLGNQLEWYESSLASPEWPYLGQGLSGAKGNPVLSGSGELFAGSNVNLTLSNTFAGMPAVLVIGFSRVDIPILGGTLIPFPDFKLKGLVTDANGEIIWDLVWPPGLPRDTSLYFQYWVSDATTSQGLAASNGISGTSPH